MTLYTSWEAGGPLENKTFWLAGWSDTVTAHWLGWEETWGWALLIGPKCHSWEEGRWVGFSFGLGCEWGPKGRTKTNKQTNKQTNKKSVAKVVRVNRCSETSCLLVEISPRSLQHWAGGHHWVQLSRTRWAEVCVCVCGPGESSVAHREINVLPKPANDSTMLLSWLIFHLQVVANIPLAFQKKMHLNKTCFSCEKWPP